MWSLIFTSSKLTEILRDLSSFQFIKWFNNWSNVNISVNFIKTPWKAHQTIFIYNNLSHLFNSYRKSKTIFESCIYSQTFNISVILLIQRRHTTSWKAHQTIFISNNVCHLYNSYRKSKKTFETSIYSQMFIGTPCTCTSRHSGPWPP